MNRIWFVYSSQDLPRLHVRNGFFKSIRLHQKQTGVWFGKVVTTDSTTDVQVRQALGMPLEPLDNDHVGDRIASVLPKHTAYVYTS
jgi:hypothetical protein